MKYITTLKKPTFLYWLVRIVLFIIIWLGFIYLTAEYQFLKDKEGALYWWVGGLYTTIILLVSYIGIDCIARKRGWGEKSLWNLWLSVVIFSLIISYVLLPVTLVTLFSPIIIPIFIVYILIFGFLFFSIKSK